MSSLLVVTHGSGKKDKCGFYLNRCRFVVLNNKYIYSLGALNYCCRLFSAAVVVVIVVVQSVFTRLIYSNFINIYICYTDSYRLDMCRRNYPTDVCNRGTAGKCDIFVCVGTKKNKKNKRQLHSKRKTKKKPSNYAIYIFYYYCFPSFNVLYTFIFLCYFNPFTIDNISKDIKQNANWNTRTKSKQNKNIQTNTYNSQFVCMPYTKLLFSAFATITIYIAPLQLEHFVHTFTHYPAFATTPRPQILNAFLPTQTHADSFDTQKHLFAPHCTPFFLLFFL